MSKFKDIYKREINVGDLVLCEFDNYSNSLDIGYSALCKLYPDGCFYDSTNIKIVCKNYYEVKDISLENLPPKIIYKIDSLDTELFNLYNQGNYTKDEMFNNRISNVSQIEAPCGDWVLRTNGMRELFDRELNIGDFVLYKLAKTKGYYGIVEGKNEVRTQTNAIDKMNTVFKITNPNSEEIKIYKELVQKQKQLQKLNILKKNIAPFERGNIYLNKTKKLMYLYVGDCSLVAKSIEAEKVHKTSNIVLEFDLKNVKSGELFDEILKGKNVSIKDIQKAFNKSLAVCSDMDTIFRKTNYNRLKNLNNIPSTSLYYLFGKVLINEPLEICCSKPYNESEIKVYLVV